jgi:hypothetical protein
MTAIRKIGASRLGRLGLALLTILFLALAVLAFPQPLFAHQTSYRNFEIWSDRPIDPAIGGVLDDALRRLETSELYSPGQTFRIFFCNSDWRMWIYSQRFNSALGGAADNWLTQNIYLRTSDIAGNALIAPGDVPLSDADVRPLSYFIAHEAAHILEARAFGRFMGLVYPVWLTEGYADLVGKGGDFDAAENLSLLQAGDPRLDYQQSGLYRGYHLMVLHALDLRGGSVRRLFDDPPDGEEILRDLASTGGLPTRD